MDRSIFDQMAVVQTNHWWFVSRRRILRSIIAQLPIAANARILELGAGTGSNLEMLSEFGTVVACETDHQSRDLCVERGWKVIDGYLPDGISHLEGKFDLICLFDVLEHIEHDAESIASLADKLHPDGRLLITCPAYGWLFGKYDVALGHFRRYSVRSLSHLLVQCGLRVERKGYFNTVLFPLIVAGRAAEFLGSNTRRDALALPPRIINWTLSRLFSLEALITGRFLFPFGSTVIVCGTLKTPSK